MIGQILKHYFSPYVARTILTQFKVVSKTISVAVLLLLFIYLSDIKCNNCYKITYIINDTQP